MAKETHKEKVARLKVMAIAAAEVSYHYKITANSIGITDETLKSWRDEDEDFSHRLEEARARFINKQMAKARPEFLLERLEPEIFKERKVSEIENPDGSLNPLKGLSSDDLRVLVAELQDK